MGRHRSLAALLVCLLLASACVEEKVIFVERSGCLSCHRPLDEAGKGHGIEQAHPAVEGHEFTCQGCHGGDPEARQQWLAHISAGKNADNFIRNLTIGELDEVDEAYLRFVNPGDYRIVQQSCGTGAGKGCHGKIIDRSVSNQMATFSGELGIARYRAGMQNSPESVMAIYNVRDDAYEFGKIPGTVGLLQKMKEPKVVAGTSEIGPYQDIYLTKACMRCHTWSFGDNKFAGDFRSSGCSSCHVLYGDDGLSRSADPTVERDAPPHPEKHVMTAKIPTNQCVHCHYRGGRIGLSYQGYREGAGAQLDSKKVGHLGTPLHGHDASFYITDEDVTNDIDETPPDVHFEAGMDCVDCHFSHDVHGDGHLYTSTQVAVEVRCQDCHGTDKAEATMITRLGNRIEELQRDGQGRYWLTTKVSAKKLAVPQIKQALDKADKGSYLHRSMGRDENGFSHLDSLACHTCHSAWIPNCYGCHVTADMRDVQRSLISGISTPGRLSGSRRWVATDDLILMLDIHGKIAPSMPSERMFFTAIDGSGNKVIDKQVRKGPQGVVGHGQRAFNPHTIRRWSGWMRCDRCHSIKGSDSNKEQLDVVMGFGSDRYIEVDGNGKAWHLDQVQTKSYLPTVLPGHRRPKASKPLPKEIVERMLKVEVEDQGCPVPGDVAVPWSTIQSTILTPGCSLSKCHDATTSADGLSLAPADAYKSLLQRSSAHSGARLVVPGKPQESYLVAKLQSKGGITGKRMPLDAPALQPCQLEMVQGWILAGAKEK